MPAAKPLTFSERLARFKKKQLVKRHKQPNFILIIMANTHDGKIAKACEKDARSVRKVFKNISRHVGFEFCEITISGKDYNGKNLDKAVESIETPSAEICVFYYSGHGFSYDKDGHTKYPQIDLRAHDDKTRYNDMDYINNHTLNLSSMLLHLRLSGSRINIVIGDCCSSNVTHKRTKESHTEMAIVKDLTPPVVKSITKRIFNSENHTVSILVSSSQHTEYAISDPKIGSIFTHFLTHTLADTLSQEAEDESYLPWHQLLEKTAAKTHRLSKTYDIGGGKPGNQQAIFEILVEKE